MSFIEGESADLTWVYAVGAGVAVIIIIGIIIICRRVKHQSKITQAVKKERKKGIHRTWGERSRSSILLIEAK